MKNLLATLILISFTAITFAQTTFTTTALHAKYDSKVTFLQYEQWKVKNNYTEIADPTYTAKEIAEIKMVAKSGCDLKLNSGDYLIKGKKQAVTGLVLQIVGGAIGCGGSLITKNMLENGDINEKTAVNITKGTTIGACALGLIGLGFEISGWCNVGKAGLSLNQNGIGVKVNF